MKLRASPRTCRDRVLFMLFVGNHRILTYLGMLNTAVALVAVCRGQGQAAIKYLGIRFVRTIPRWYHTQHPGKLPGTRSGEDKTGRPGSLTLSFLGGHIPLPPASSAASERRPKGCASAGLEMISQNIFLRGRPEEGW
jgi:hypothetical protein